MKIGESFKIEDGKLVHIEKHDPNPYLGQATYLRHKREATGKLFNFVNDEICEPQYAYPRFWSKSGVTSGAFARMTQPLMTSSRSN